MLVKRGINTPLIYSVPYPFLRHEKTLNDVWQVSKLKELIKCVEQSYGCDIQAKMELHVRLLAFEADSYVQTWKEYLSAYTIGPVSLTLKSTFLKLTYNLQLIILITNTQYKVPMKQRNIVGYNP